MKYKRVLNQFRSVGLERIFSNNLGDAIGISAALVRKDMNRIELQGNRRGGYNIDTMLRRLNEILGTQKFREIILIGCGNLGRALLNHDAFLNEGIRITAGFDAFPQESRIGDVPVHDMSLLESYIQKNAVKVAVISTPSHVVTEIRDRLVTAGIRGILNFAPLELKSQPGCVIQNVNIGLEIENLFFLVKGQDDKMMS